MARAKEVAELGSVITVDSGNVGVGVATPVYPMDVLSNTNAIGVSIRGRSADNIGLYNFTSNNGSTQYGYLLGSPTELRVAQNGANYITAYTNGAERMRIDSSGNLFIGKTSDNSNNQGLSFFPSGAVQSANNGAGTVTHHEFYRSGTRVGKVDSSTTGITVTGIQGLSFTATQSASSNANTLDDYEEGTWTPTLSFGGNSVGMTYSTRVGYYRKVGGLVHCQCVIVLSNKGSSTGNAAITGVPFASAITSSDGRQTASLYTANVSLSSGDIPQLLIISDSSQKIDLNFRSPSGSDGNISSSSFANNSYLVVTWTFASD